MKQTVLLTKNPVFFRRALPNTSRSFLMLEPQQFLQKSYPADRLLVDTTSLGSEIFSPAELFSQTCFYQPTVIYAEAQELVRLLLQPPPPTKETIPKIPAEFDCLMDKMLLQLEFSPALKGYLYIKQAVYYQCLHHQEPSALKKDIYEAVSERFRTSVYSVERGITFSIRKAYQKNGGSFAPLFSQQEKPPGNLTFVKTVSIHLKPYFTK